MKTYQIEIVGKTPLLLHSDDVEWADRMTAWAADPMNKKVSKAGDDRTPAWRWVGYAYHDGEHLTMPTDNVMKSLMQAGAMVPVPGGGKKTFKAQTQSGMFCNESDWVLHGANGPIKVADVHALMQNDVFAEHHPIVRDLGFELHVKRATIGNSKHIRVRPIFRQWVIAGTITVTDDQITEQVLRDIVGYAGMYKGLGDWRPSSPKVPGRYGTFAGTVKKV